MNTSFYDLLYVTYLADRQLLIQLSVRLQETLQVQECFSVHLIPLSHQTIEWILFDVFRWTAVGLSTQTDTHTMITVTTCSPLL